MLRQISRCGDFWKTNQLYGVDIYTFENTLWRMFSKDHTVWLKMYEMYNQGKRQI